MTTDRDIERVLDRWFEDGPSTVAERVVDAALLTVASTPQARGLGVPRWRQRVGRSGLALAGLAVAAVAIVVVASSLVMRPSPLLIGGPTPSGEPTTVAASPSTASPIPSATAPAVIGTPRLAYVKVTHTGPDSGPDSDQSTKVWTSAPDGSDARATAPGAGACQFGPTWSPDGAELVFSAREQAVIGGLGRYCYAWPFGGRLFVAAADGSSADPLPTGCTDPCSWEDGGAFSPDGGKIAFVRHWGDREHQSSAIAVLDLATGVVDVLESTRGSDVDSDPVTSDANGADRPRWSPDGSKIAYTRFSATATSDDSTIYVVGADGSGLRVLSAHAAFPAWSPDGSRIAFTSRVVQVIGDGSAPGAWRTYTDIETIRPDGSDLQRLTTDRWSSLPSWTADGRIRYNSWPITYGKEVVAEDAAWWVIDADGSHRETLPAFLNALDAGWIAWPVG